jgi:DNA-directed RNA polymerase specialized sigma24 family protein
MKSCPSHLARHATSAALDRDASHALELMARVARGQREAQLELLERVGAGMQRTLHRLVGSDAPVEPLLETSLLMALNRASEYTGDESLALWAQRITVQLAMSYLGGAPSPSLPSAANEVEAGAELTPKVCDLLGRVRAILRRMRPEEQVAFALLDLDGRSLREASSLTGASPMVVRQRASRARRHLLFAARSDRLIAGYVRLSDPLRKLAERLHRMRLGRLRTDSLRRVELRVVDALTPAPFGRVAGSDAAGSRVSASHVSGSHVSASRVAVSRARADTAR